MGTNVYASPKSPVGSLNGDDRRFHIQMYLIFLATYIYSIYKYHSILHSKKWLACIPTKCCLVLISVVLVTGGSQMPTAMIIMLLSIIPTLGIVSAAAKMKVYQFDIGSGVCDIFNCVALAYLSLDMLSPQIKQCLAKHRRTILASNLFATSITFFALAPANLDSTRKLEVLPLAGLFATSVIFSTIDRFSLFHGSAIIEDGLLNVSFLLCSLAGLVLNGVRQRFFEWEDEDPDDPEFLEEIIADHNIPLWQGVGTVSVVSVLACTISVLIFNILCNWSTAIAAKKEKPISSEELGNTGLMYLYSFIKRDRVLFWMYLVTAISLIGYFCLHTSVYINVQKSQQRVWEGYRDDDDSGELGNLAIYGRELSRRFGLLVIVGNFLLFYLAYALLPFEYSVPKDVIIISVSVLMVSGYTASTSSMAFSRHDVGCYILAQSGLICLLIDMLSPGKKIELSCLKNYLFLIAQLCGQVTFIEAISFKKCSLIIAPLAIVAIEFVGLGLIMSYATLKGMDNYILSCFVISLSTKLSLKAPATPSQVGWNEFFRRICILTFEEFCGWVCRSLIFYVSSLLVYRVLSS